MEVLPYMFQCITFVLMDSQRTCKPIVAAFSGFFVPEKRACVQEIAIPFSTIRGLFDPSHFIHALALVPVQSGAQLQPYVLAKLDSNDYMKLRGTGSYLRKDYEYALQLLNQMPRLSYLKLGVDVVEFLAYSAPESTSEMPNLAFILGLVRQGRLN
jgi:hypothetical protein